MPSQENRANNRSGPGLKPGLGQGEPVSGPLPAGGGLTRPVENDWSGVDRRLTTGRVPAVGGETPKLTTGRVLAVGGETSKLTTGRVPTVSGKVPIPVVGGQFTNANLARVLTSTMDTSTSQRIPVVIKGSMKKPNRAPLAPAAHRRRRLAVTLIGIVMFMLVASATLLYTVAPLGHDQSLGWNPLARLPGNKMFTNQNGGLSKVVVQATATAVYHQQTDGYSGGAAQLVGNGAGSLNWPIGQCTYWANSRYHALTGHWVPWSGNANQWVTGARAAGWKVSTTPHVPSIIVLMGVQGANAYYGHVAAVESIVAGASPVTVHTSNMNWFADGGGWNIESYWNFTVGSGVYFVWHP